tara:strand:- start:953 stop:1474 length:522 start_codon:yes stop_codon:yes gene_type:complete
MTLSNTTNPGDPNADLSNWALEPEKKSPLRDAVVAENYSVSLKSSSDAIFGELNSSSTSNTGSYLRGLQLLYMFGLENVALAYWNDADAQREILREEIDNSVRVEDLIAKSEIFEEHRVKLKMVIQNSRIPNDIIDIVRAEVSGLGDLAGLLEAVLYYYIILGEANSAGGVKV